MTTVTTPIVSETPSIKGRALACVPELLLAAVGLAMFFLMPDDLGLATRILIASLFALSLDFVLGYAGIVTLGHAAMFGIGAYAAGIFAVRVSNDPLLGLAVGGLAGAVVALVSGLLVLRSQGLTSVMITLAIAQLLAEIASKWSSVTGGDDGLSGINTAPVLGMFEFDFLGRTGYLYALVILVIAFAILRRIVASPFGITSIGIREDRGRMSALGSRVVRHLTLVYAIGGAFAGIAGAISAQVTQVVGLSSLSFAHSAEVLVMLVLGGVGRLWGALLGPAVFIWVHHYAAAVDPLRWMFVIGGMLLIVVLVAPGGMAGALSDLWARLQKRLQGGQS